jgi:hypothetical protein
MQGWVDDNITNNWDPNEKTFLVVGNPEMSEEQKTGYSHVGLFPLCLLEGEYITCPKVVNIAIITF